MPDTAETDSYEMLCEDWGSAYLITRAPGTAHPCKAARRDDPPSSSPPPAPRRCGS